MSASTLHSLLLLSDSALPLGSFAFSSGLESFLSHNKTSHANAAARLRAFDVFLEHSLTNVASTALPYVLNAYADPTRLQDLDNDFDASTPCTVARRASVAQGRALLGVWERALAGSIGEEAESQLAATVLADFGLLMKSNKPDDFGFGPNGHFPALFGITCVAMGLSRTDTAYLFMMNHAKALLSAAVRASVMGPFQSQMLLASAKLQNCLRTCIEQEQDNLAALTAVTAPPMDLWMGRHELLYSRIFNS
ncbi:hypothetical protein KC315_g4471 [Hortaea werneckii]|nr:hypothetical protein KC315_g4471 [Hortaea werneckii]KAI7366366.1 hypothetical protein KC354_g4195 [Hortaea werneckii]